MRPLFLVIRLLKTLTWVGSLVFLLFIYYYLPEKIAVHYNTEGVPDNFLSREAFFYVATGFIILLNVVLSLINWLVMGLPEPVLQVPNRAYWLADATRREQLMYVLRNWVNSLGTALNVYLIVLIFITLRLHTNQAVFLSDFTWMLFAGLLLLVVWGAYLPIRLRYSRTVGI